MDKLSKEERCISCIEAHAQMYRSPADKNFICNVMKDFHNMTTEETMDLLSELKKAKKIDYWTGKFIEGWVNKCTL